MKPGAAWCVVHTRPNAEELAMRNLERQGYEVFLPCYLKRRRHARKVEIVPRPLFPRYLLVAIDFAVDRWLSVRSTFGVSTLVCQGNHPATVPLDVVDELRSRSDKHGLVDFTESPAFSPGDEVHLLHGAFARLVGRVERLSDHERVAVLLDIMGRSVRVMLSADALEPAC